MSPPPLHVAWIGAVLLAVVAIFFAAASRRAAGLPAFFSSSLDDEGRAFTAAVDGLQGPGGSRGPSVIRRWIGRLGVRPDRRDDVLQDILEKLWNLSPTFDPQRRATDGTRDPARMFASWVRAIVLNIVLSHRERMEVRDRREVLEQDEPPEHPDPAPLAPEIIEAEQARRSLFDRIHALPSPMRDVLISHDLDQIPIVEIAQMIGTSTAGAYRLRAAAMEELQERAAAEGEPSG